jgi:hypothetical protein
VTSLPNPVTLGAMNSLPRFAVAAFLLAASAAGRAQTIADLPDDKFKSLLDKTTLYSKAITAARAVQKSYDHYASWVDVKKGPTGKERAIDSGLPDIGGALQAIADAGKNGPGMWPPLPNIDATARPDDDNARSARKGRLRLLFSAPI